MSVQPYGKKLPKMTSFEGMKIDDVTPDPLNTPVKLVFGDKAGKRYVLPTTMGVMAEIAEMLDQMKHGTLRKEPRG